MTFSNIYIPELYQMKHGKESDFINEQKKNRLPGSFFARSVILTYYYSATVTDVTTLFTITTLTGVFGAAAYPCSVPSVACPPY